MFHYTLWAKMFLTCSSVYNILCGRHNWAVVFNSVGRISEHALFTPIVASQLSGMSLQTSHPLFFILSILCILSTQKNQFHLVDLFASIAYFSFLSLAFQNGQPQTHYHHTRGPALVGQQRQCKCGRSLCGRQGSRREAVCIRLLPAT